MFFRNGLAATAVAALSLSTLGASTTSRSIKRTSGDACAKVAEYFADGETSLPAEIAHECMTSIPFDSKRSVYVTQQLQKFTQIYSAQAFFYDPPTEQLKIKPVDLNGTFAEIEKKASKEDGYANEYEFQLSLMSLFESFHDGHVYYYPSCSSQFKFYHDYPLVAIYKEGQDIPSIHVADPDTGEVGQEVVEINGEETHKHLARLASELPGLPWIDPDARWNELLMSKHPVNGISRGVFAYRDFWFEKSFPMKYKNGEEVQVEWVAYMDDEPVYQNQEEYLNYVCLDAYYKDVLEDTPEEEVEVEVEGSGKKGHHHKTKKPGHHKIPDEVEHHFQHGWNTHTTVEHPHRGGKKNKGHVKGSHKKPHHGIPEETQDHRYGWGIATHEEHPVEHQKKKGSHKKQSSHKKSSKHKDSHPKPHHIPKEPLNKAYGWSHEGGHHIPKESHHSAFGWNHHADPPNQRRALDRAVERRLNEKLREKKLKKRAHPKVEHLPPPKHGDNVYHAIKGSDDPEDEGTPIEEEEEERITTIPDVPIPIEWPEPALKMNGNEQTIYKLNDNTIVWGIHAFADIDGNDEFLQHWQDFIEEGFKYCKTHKIKHVIIDVSGNGGGYVSLGIATIKQFFPDASPYYGFDLRRSPAMDLLIEYSADSDDSHLDLNDTKNIDNEDFASIEEFLGPVHKYGDYFTAIGRWDPEDNIKDLGLEIPSHDPPFTKDNIIILSNGCCGSTCAIFGEAMSNIGVKSIATNGITDAKQGKKYMQHVGGIKGSQVWGWDAFMTSHVEAYVENPEQYDFLPKRMPINHQSSMNLRNSYEPGSDIPLEFVWQPANGHFYTTEEMWKDRAKLWAKAAEMSWGKDGKNILKDLPEDVVKASRQHKGGLKSGPKGPLGDSDQITFSGRETWGYFINLWFQSIKQELPDL